MAMWDRLGQRLNTRQMMEQDLASVEEAQLQDAYQELQQRRSARERPSGFGLSGPGARDYFRRQGNDSDRAFLRSMLQTGERPRVRVGYTDDEEPTSWADRASRTADLTARTKLTADDAYAIQQLLLQQRLKQQGF